MPNVHLLIIDNDLPFYTIFRDQYEGAYVIDYASNHESGFERLRKNQYDAVLLDLEFPPKSFDYGLKKLLPQAVRLAKGRFPIIVVSNDTRRSTLQKVQEGAATLFLLKSQLDLETWDLEIKRAILKFQIAKDSAKKGGKSHEDTKGPSGTVVVSVSPVMEAIRRDLTTLTRFTKTSILLRGESGTGKSLLASFLHEAKNDPKLPFVKKNLSAIAPELLGSELFGHVKGAFTGADRDKVGLLEAAGKGTLFLDEIGEISTNLQVMLLNVLDDRVFQRVGAPDRNIPLEAQLVFATNADLEAAVAAKSFRADFYERLSGKQIWVPPLRERPEEIVPLVEHFLPRIIEHEAHPLFGKPFQDCFTQDALDILRNYNWPNNARELFNVVQGLVIDADTQGRSVIDASMIAGRYRHPAPISSTTSNDPVSTEAQTNALTGPLPRPEWSPKKKGDYWELKSLFDALERSAWKKGLAAESLGYKSDDNIKTKVIAIHKRYPELLDIFPTLKTSYSKSLGE
jgi:DNA-binding NtrC family response regulator